MASSERSRSLLSQNMLEEVGGRLRITSSSPSLYGVFLRVGMLDRCWKFLAPEVELRRFAGEISPSPLRAVNDPRRDKLLPKGLPLRFVESAYQIHEEVWCPGHVAHDHLAALVTMGIVGYSVPGV